MDSKLNIDYIRTVVREALDEDIGSGDITSDLIIPADRKSNAKIIVHEEGVLAGVDVAKEVFYAAGKDIKFIPKLRDGDSFKLGDEIATLEGLSLGMLAGERVALNFLQRLSGIATKTKAFVDEVAGYDVVILDTRKTTPGLRLLEKYAVRVGGGTNHRMGLYDMILIKDNHIACGGVVFNDRERKESSRGLGDIIREAKKIYPNVRVEVESSTVKDAKNAAKSGADIVMLDNMSVSDMSKATRYIRSRSLKKKTNVQVEASGKINRNNVRRIARTGVDRISVGSLTHSVKALDISLDVTDVF